MRYCLLFVGFLMILVGCARTDVPMKGVVGGFDSDFSKIFIAHEAVEGMMPEMAMAFNADSAEIADLSVGEAVSFVLHVRRSESWITGVKKIPRSAVQLSPDRQTTASDAVNLLLPGSVFPRVQLVDQTGAKIIVPDKTENLDATLIDFIYTRCPLPDYCPLLSSRFREVQKRTDSGVALVSVTIDPDFDTPAVLGEYAKRYRADYERWRFVTGNRETLDSLYAAAGINIFAESGTLNHNLATILLDRDGKVARIWRDTDGTVDDIIEEIALID